MKKQLFRGGMALGSAAALACVGLVPAGQALAEQTSRASSQIIEEVTVTARKREERVVDTPVAVSVMGEEDLERYNTRDLAQLTQRIPGLSIVNGQGGGAGGNITIRGIGKPPGSSDYALDAPVSLVIDGMAFSRNHMIKTGFFDSEAVEVLKGPQALYFGKNSPAGVIAIRSKSPEVGGEMELNVRAGYEFVTEDPTIEAGISLPIGEHLAVRFAARGQDMDGGFLKNTAQPLDASALYPGTDYVTGGASYKDFPAQSQAVWRMTTVWEPTDTFDATLKLFRSYTKRNDAGQVIQWSCADGPGANPTYFGIHTDPTQICPDSKVKLRGNGALPPPEVADAAPFIDRDSRFHDKLDQYMHTLQMNWEVGDFTLTSVTGYWDYRHREYTNYDYLSYGVVVSKQGESGESFTQEVRLASSFDGPLNFTLGGFYENAERELNAPVQLAPPSLFLAFGLPESPVPYVAGSKPSNLNDEQYDGTYINYHQIWNNDIDSWSVFGSFDWEVNEKLEISGGLRYTKEDREASGGNVFENSSFFGYGPGDLVYNPKDTSDNVSPEVTVSYHINDDLMVYGSFKTGFQSAGISNPGTVPNLGDFTVEEQNEILIFDETTIEGFELGLKGTFFEGRMRADLAAFWYESKDLQVAIFNSNTTTFTLQNAAVVHNWGFEGNMIYQVNDRLQLRLAGQFNHLEFDEWDDAGCHPVDGALSRDELLARSAPDCHTVVDPESGADVTTQDLSGVRYGGPPFQANIGFTYDMPLMRDWRLIFDWDTIHHNKGKRTLNQPFTEIPARTVTNIGATLTQDGGNWEAGVICTNCFNELYVYSIGNRPLAKIIPGERGDMTGQVAPPRLVSLYLTYRM
jgi:outer membrane receptor protein involved in Fe transport